MIKKSQIKKILQEIRRASGEEEKTNEAYHNLFSIIAPSSYPPIIEQGKTDAYINGVSTLVPEIKDDLEYFAYEAPLIKKATCVDSDGKEYDANNIDEYADFVYNYIEK